jgi:hypothetical protein
MTFIFLPKKHHLSLENLPDGRYYTKDQLLGFVCQVPHGCAPVFCLYNGDWIDHSWTNPMSGRVHETHPLGLTTKDTSFYEGFYEITTIDGLTFREGDAWCPDTGAKIHVEKTDQQSIWNPFFQRYDPPCENYWQCKGVKKEMESSSDRGSYLYLDRFTQCKHLFVEVYCKCRMRDGREHHTDSDSD